MPRFARGGGSGSVFVFVLRISRAVSLQYAIAVAFAGDPSWSNRAFQIR
jgi:hypothetical protein